MLHRQNTSNSHTGLGCRGPVGIHKCHLRGLPNVLPWHDNRQPGPVPTRIVNTHQTSGRNQLRLPALLGLGVTRHLQTYHHQISTGIVRCRFTPNVHSGVQVGEERIAIERAKWNSKHQIEKIRRKDMHLQCLCQVKNLPMMNGTHQDGGQDSKRGRPDTRIHRKDGETL